MFSDSIGSAERAARPLDLRQRFSFLGRYRYQLASGLLLAVLLPELLWFQLEFTWFQAGSTQNTLIGTAIALVAGSYLLRRVSRYPGVAATAPVIPTFAVAYAAVITVFFFLRVDYSRFLFIASFVAAVAWFSFLVILERRALRPLLLVVPYGKSKRLLAQSLAHWRVADLPDAIPPDCTGVVADFRADLPAEWQKFLATCALKGIPVYHWKQIAESLTGRVEIEHLSENNFGSLVPSSLYFRFKRMADLLFAIAAFPFALIVAGAIALAIKIDGPGPVLFRQCRLGFGGRHFTMLKFRTMKPQAEPGTLYTQHNDSRITRVGRFLRRYRFDELPQIVNILKGEMSWIGPRPEALSLATWYESEIPFYAYRHIVRPGISGWAQVNQGNVAEVAAATSKLHYDFFYIKHFSFWLDLLIAAKTVRTVLTGFGAR